MKTVLLFLFLVLSAAAQTKDANPRQLKGGSSVDGTLTIDTTFTLMAVTSATATTAYYTCTMRLQ